jgi:hypothetical protein
MQAPTPKRLSGPVFMLTALAVIVAIGVVQPAIGSGPSLGGLAKQLKKLKKRVANVEKQPGPGGPGGPGGAPGPSFGTGQRFNGQDIPCNAETVVGSQAINVPQRSRIWVYGQGTVLAQGSGETELLLLVRLRDSANTTTLAESTNSWTAGSEVTTLSTGGVLFTDTTGSYVGEPPYVAEAGTYVLQLVAGTTSSGTCPDDLRFGWNGDGLLSYALLGPG